MGEVYKARDTRLGRTVAIKILSPRLAEDPHFRVRFEHEARAISQLSHPHICTLYDVGEGGGPDASSGTPGSYIVMEFVEGETLAERLARGPLPLDQALAYAVQIADALDKAHRHGFVHRDLKPGNVMVTKKAGVKLLDFGLTEQRAQALPPGWADAVTRTSAIGPPGTVLGTLQYLAPEQLEGKESDERTDIFACGAVIYEMVTGRKAFEGISPASVIAAIMQPDRPSVTAVQPSAPLALEHVVSTCLAKDPDERWQHAGDLTRELKWIAAVGRLRAAPQAPVLARTGQRVWVAVAGLFLLSTLALAARQFLRPSVTDVSVYRTSILLPEGLRFPGAGAVGGIGRFAISPDGRRMAFVATDPNGNQMLWLRPLDSLAATSLAGTDGASSPFWSPDSRVIAFVAGGQLKTVDPAGGSPIVVASAAVNATGAWNRANEILFTPTPASPLHSVSASGGTPRPVTMLDKAAGEVLHRNPFFLPDSRHFLFVAVSARNGGSTGPRAVYVSSLGANGPARLLIDGGSIAKYSQGRLIFLRDNTLMAQPFDIDRLALAGEPRPAAEQVELNGPASATFTVSDTGVLVYQPAAAQGSQLVWFDREGRQLGTVGDPARTATSSCRRTGGAQQSAYRTRSRTREKSLGLRPDPRRENALHLRPRGRSHADLVGGGLAYFLYVESQRTLRPVSEDGNRRRDRRVPVRGQFREVPDQLVAGWPVADVLGVRRRRRHPLAAASDARAQTDDVSAHAGGAGTFFAGRPVGCLLFRRVWTFGSVRRAVPRGFAEVAGVQCRGHSVAVATRWEGLFYMARDNRLMAVTVEYHGFGIRGRPAAPLTRSAPRRSAFVLRRFGGWPTVSRELAGERRPVILHHHRSELERCAEAVTNVTVAPGG